MVKLGCFLLMIITLCLSKVPSCQATSKPYCEPTEVCTVKEYYLHACRCRGNSTCGAKSDSTLDYGGVQYDFCQPMNFRQCAENEVAWAHKGITRQIVYCICPAHLKVMEDTVLRLNSNIRKFRCVAPKTCDVNETCKVRNKVFTGEKNCHIIERSVRMSRRIWLRRNWRNFETKTLLEMGTRNMEVQIVGRLKKSSITFFFIAQTVWHIFFLLKQKI